MFKRNFLFLDIYETLVKEDYWHSFWLNDDPSLVSSPRGFNITFDFEVEIKKFIVHPRYANWPDRYQNVAIFIDGSGLGVT